MRRICIAYSVAVLSLAVVSYGKDADTISFLTVNEVEAARLHLRVKGIWKFVDEALAQGVAPPRMHSKYWVDKLPVTNQPQESAFRDFGYEVAVQLNGVSLEFYKHPSTDEEVGRVKRLLRLAAWLRQPGGYENYRIARRAEGAAGMLLARVIINPDVPIETIEKLIDLFLSEEQSAILRADILWEESNGVIDVRGKARRFEEKGSFEHDWNGFLRKVDKKVDIWKLFHYSELKPELEQKIPGLVFFCDDTTPPSPRSIVATWNLKQHFATCVFGGCLINFNVIRNLFLFRREIGGFPLPNKENATRDDFATYYDDLWIPYEKKYGPIGPGAGRHYFDILHNDFTDWETHEVLRHANSSHPR